MSALIADDDVFCDHVERVWGCGNREEIDRESSITKSSIRSSSIRGPDGVSVGAEGNYGNNNNNGDDGREHGTAAADKTSPRPALSMAREACLPPPPPASKSERGPILQRGHAKDGTASRLTVPSGVLGLLGRARSSLATRGMRAAFQLLKGFREEDRRGNGKVTLSGFKKAVGEAALGLKEPEMRIIFEVGLHVPLVGT